MKNVLQYLERSMEMFPDKIAVVDENEKCTYKELVDNAKAIGTTLLNDEVERKPIIVFSEKSVKVLKTFFGVVYAGGFYVLVDPSLPEERISQIVNVLGAKVAFSREEHMEKLKKAGFHNKIYNINDTFEKVDSKRLAKIFENHIDTDPLYGNFTSGSTGVPKCVLINHKSTIDFIEQFTKTFGITSEDVIGNQAPFDFDVSVKDIYSCIFTGATIVLLPKSYFMFPTKLLDMIEENNVTTLVWAVSALCMLNRLHGFSYKVPITINKIMFSGEAMPVKQLIAWQEQYPKAMFVNLYGPTEITCNCSYHIIDHMVSLSEKIPIGKAFCNDRVFLLDENDELIDETMVEIQGEICVAGSSLAIGYFNNTEVTDKVFVQSPINKLYKERIYRTGDMGYYGNDGLMYFSGRKDFQIKHMGHRIELEEIDSIIDSCDGVEHCCTFFDEDKNKIVTAFSGTTTKVEIIECLSKKVPEYMIPNRWLQLDVLPLNKNGKTDRKKLKEMYEDGKK